MYNYTEHRERERLRALIQKDNTPARHVLKARTLLRADESEAGDGWSDSRTAKVLDTSTDATARTRQQLVEGAQQSDHGFH
jgi:hypothetical protein